MDREFFKQVTPSESQEQEHWIDTWRTNTVTPQTTSITLNTLYAFPYVSGRAQTADRIGVNKLSGAGPNVRLGIYQNTSDAVLYPAALLLDAGAVAVAGGGIASLTISQALAADALYWLAIVTDGTATFRGGGLGVCYSLLGIDPSDLNHDGVWQVSFTYAALPDPFPTTATPGNLGCCPMLRLSA